MPRTIEELNIHIVAQSSWILDLDRELNRRKLLLRDLCDEKAELCKPPIGYVVALTWGGYPQHQLTESLAPTPVYLRDHGRTIVLTKKGGHIAIINPDRTISVGMIGLMAVLHLGEAAISCGGVVIRYGRTIEDVRRNTMSFGEIKARL